MHFSKIINGFIPEEWLTDGTYKKLPEDAVNMTPIEVDTFYKVTPPAGKELGIVAGRLAWVDLPPPTAEELVAQAEQQKNQLRKAADSEIAWLQDAVDAGIATDEEIALLAEWKKYRVLLMRVDTSKAPDIEWPKPPVG